MVAEKIAAVPEKKVLVGPIYPIKSYLFSYSVVRNPHDTLRVLKKSICM